MLDLLRVRTGRALQRTARRGAGPSSKRARPIHRKPLQDASRALRLRAVRDPTSSLPRPDETETFWADGVVCLRGVLPAGWLARLEVAVEEVLASGDGTDLSAMAAQIAAGGGTVLRDAAAGARPRGRFFAGIDHWRRHATFRELALESPLPAVAAALLRSREVALYEDSVLVKEPGALERTAFHQDMAYFHVSGDQVCTTWCPLDLVSAATGAVKYVRGSHRWQREFQPNVFVSTAAIPGTLGDAVPDVESDPERYELLSFDTAPGDVVVHHARTIHGAAGNASATRRRRAVSVRYCGDDVRFHRRPGAPLKPSQEGALEGTRLDPAACPIAHRAG
jgi:ectoine hydroxylase-related dioxygenase (phytanoyl-CoA dioxygenase family)